MTSPVKGFGQIKKRWQALRQWLADGLRKLQHLALLGRVRAAESWLVFWLSGLTLLWLWDFFFLNRPAFHTLNQAFVNSLFVALLVVVFSFVQGWAWSMLLHFLEEHEHYKGLTVAHFVLNLVRSIPQIVGILFSYIWLTIWLEKGIINNQWVILILMALLISVFIFLEVVDLLSERIRFFQRLDFYNAMRVCGISTWRIINYDIIWKNSLQHLLNKAVGVFASAIFLQCSVDFIISVGLSIRVSAVNLPITLGSLLAQIDSKQDILAISYTLSHPAYWPNLLFRHLQGLSVAFVIIFTLICLFKITNSIAERLEK